MSAAWPNESCEISISQADSALVISSSGCNRVPIEMAEGFKKAGMKVVVLISKQHSQASQSHDARGLACRISLTSYWIPARQ